MRLLGPTRYSKLNEASAVVFFAVAVFLILSLISFHPTDPSWNTAARAGVKALNRMGRGGAFTGDLLLQVFGVASYAIPALLILLAWKWVRSKPIEVPLAKIAGVAILLSAACAGFSLIPFLPRIGDALPIGGTLGVLAADTLIGWLNIIGAILTVVTSLILSLYLVSTFSFATLPAWYSAPLAWWNGVLRRWTAWRSAHRRLKQEKAGLKAQRARLKQEKARLKEEARQNITRPADAEAIEAEEPADEEAPPFDTEPDIPIRTLEDLAPPPPPPQYEPLRIVEEAAQPQTALEPDPEPVKRAREAPRRPASYSLPPTAVLNEAAARGGYDSQELKEIAVRIKAKFEEFAVLGNIVQINPGPVVTTFEFKPEAGIKYSKIITLTEDLCLGLQAESILIERIPGKPTVGIEVPNSKREVISLRQILESEEFTGSGSKLTMSLGKDINGRIRVASLESMPHLLIAGSTGSGKSVMLNSLIMSVIYKATPDDVRMILVDPKRVEMGIYEGIPHLLTPVITDAKKATNALRNAVLEMERRLKLLASQGVRNIEQFNKKVRQMRAEPRNLFSEDEPEPEELKPLPLILILIDELADLMMLERANVEESVTRLAQMARAVGMHLVLATQRPSVDVITGLIKANFPSRISFRVATRVDSRTVLDVMGAEHLLGKGDMLFLPPGSSRLTRVHGAFVTENEINRVVEFWKLQARPDYDQSFLLPPPSEEEEGAEAFNGDQDPMYEDAVRVVLEMGKASTSILQRRLRLGYGRAARILDMMQHEGIIGPPDGSRPRDVLKRPDWLREVEDTLR